VKLYDTSIWVDFLRDGDPNFAAELDSKRVLCHPFVIGEILLGSITGRPMMERMLNDLPLVQRASDKEVLFFLRSNKIYGRGIGWVDTHLLVSAKMTGVKLATRDKKLARVAEELDIG
jgi:predicted nucleic acid-binding protein